MICSSLPRIYLAHGIRNPLAAIQGVAEAFLQRGQLTRQEREWMEAVRHEVMKIDERVRELLDISRPRIFNNKPCSLSELINRVVLVATHRLRSTNNHPARKIGVEFIDETTEPLVMHLDSGRIEDAVLNLVLNAMESIDGDGRVAIYLRRQTWASGNDEAMIEVTDTGCGIPLEIRRRKYLSRCSQLNEKELVLALRLCDAPPPLTTVVSLLKREVAVASNVCTVPADTFSTQPR